MEITEPRLGIGNSGISIVSEETAAALAKKKISPSLISGIENCPASWAAGNFVMRDIEEEPDNPKTRGQLFHRVMEMLFSAPPEERTREKVAEIKAEVLKEEEFAVFLGIPAALEWLDSAINGYYKMGGRPQKVNIASIKREEDSEPIPGLEIFVEGSLAGANRRTLGFIDRLTISPDTPDAVIVEDWKSGAKAKKWNGSLKSNDGLPDARQQVIYSMLLEQQGINVAGARLIFPVAKEIVEVDLEDENLKARVLADIKKTDEALDNFIENNNFEYKPSFLCAWCPIAKICPKAEISNFAKAKEAFNKQPSIEKLAAGFTFL